MCYEVCFALTTEREESSNAVKINGLSWDRRGRSGRWRHFWYS